MNAATLSNLHRQLIEDAALHTDGQITSFPVNIKGGARAKVLASLANQGMIISVEQPLLTDAAYAAVGIDRPATPDATEEPAPAEIDAKHEEAAATPEANASTIAATDTPADAPTKETPATDPTLKAVRPDSKAAKVIEMLRRPIGASIREICGKTGWLSHTVRGFFAGTVRKKLQLNLVSEKSVNSERVYRIVDDAPAAE